MKLTLEALYLLQLFNDFSDDLSFIPLPVLKNENRKDALIRTIEKGYEDLKAVGLIEDDKPTEECVEYCYFLKEYHESFYHYQIDQSYFCAPSVDKFKRMTVVLLKDDEGFYSIYRLPSSILLGAIMRNHELLHHLDDRVKDYIHSDFEIEPLFSLLVNHGQTEALRISVEELGRNTQNVVYYEKKNSIYEYDLNREVQRSIDSDELKNLILRRMKVEV